MNNLIITSSMSKEEIIHHYERMGADCLKLAEENAQLISDNRHFRNEIEKLESLIRSLKKSKK